MKHIEPTELDHILKPQRQTLKSHARNKPELPCTCGRPTRGRTDDGKPFCAVCLMDAEAARRERIKQIKL